MELPGSVYLYTLCDAGDDICRLLRNRHRPASTGKNLSGFHLVLTRLYLESGLFAAAFCMLPPLLALCGLAETAVWRVSSAITAAVLLCFGATYPMHRAAITAGSLPRARWMPIVSASMFVVIAFLGNAAGFPYRPTIGPIVVAATWTLGCGATIFVLALNAVWDTTEAETRR